MLLPKSVFPISRSVPKADDSRYLLPGVHVKRVDEKNGRVEATDGHQLVRVDFPMQYNTEFPTVDGANYDSVEGFETVVPVSAWNDAAKNLPKRSNIPVLLNVLLSENANGSLQLITSDLENKRQVEAKTLEGKFPDVEAVIPKELPVISKEQINAIESPDENEATVQHYVKIGFNAELLAGVLQTVAKIQDLKEGHGVTLYVPIEGTSALVIKAAGQNQEQITALVMPMRVD